jgi:hypothetical protein
MAGSTPGVAHCICLTLAPASPFRGSGIFEVLNVPEPVTYVLAADGLPAANRALDDAGFHPQALGADQIPHDATWPTRIAALTGTNR